MEITVRDRKIVFIYYLPTEITSRVLEAGFNIQMSVGMIYVKEEI